MDSLNRLFTEKAASLRSDALQELDAFLILYNDSLYTVLPNVEHFQSFASLDLQKYTLYKTLAHYIIYASLKHDRNYEKINDLCATLRDNAANTAGIEIKEFFDYDVKELMRMASNEYVAQLHAIVQRLKTERYQGKWPEKMLILVCGPASPRYGHPAMQYFARLANKPLEQLASHCCTSAEEKREHCNASTTREKEQKEITYFPSDGAQYHGRKLFYVENAHTLAEAERIGLSLYVEDTVFSRFVSMKTDILAPLVQETLKKECQK